MKALEIMAVFLAIVLVVMGGVLVLKNNKNQTSQIAQLTQKKKLDPVKRKTIASAVKTFTPPIKDKPKSQEKNLTNQLGVQLSKGQEVSLDNLENSGDFFVVPEVPDQKIKISSQASPEEYFISLTKAIPELNIPQTELEAIEQAVVSENYHALDVYIANYQNAYKKIKTLAVPPSLVKLHKEQLGALDLAEQILLAFRNYKNDPAKAILALAKYPELEQSVYNLVKKITAYGN